MSARPRSISPSTSIRSFNSFDSEDSDESDPNEKYAGMTEEELMNLWERRNLYYFDRRQRLLAEAEQKQEQEEQQQCQQEDDMGEEDGDEEMEQSYASENPQWEDVTSRNIMGDYDPQRNTDPAAPVYQNAWMSCQRLVNMNRSVSSADSYIPSNPRLAALLENQRAEMARERHQEEEYRQGNYFSTHYQDGAVEEVGMEVDGGATSSTCCPTHQAYSASVTTAQAAQAAEYERLSEAHRRSVSGKNNSSSGKKEKSTQVKSYYLALPYQTQQFVKSVFCTTCNCSLYTIPVAKMFFCQTCGSISSVPRQGYEEGKIQDAEDQGVLMSW